ncbi:MAG: Na+/H+ antiporter NhaA [Planctomycetota bacterium]|nr:Na+/H+ antiporter NhaA [Planctomycetota bacterium]
MSNQKNGFVNFLQEFSIPLLAGVVCALLAANLAPDWYLEWFGHPHGDDPHGIWTLGFQMFGKWVGLHFIINDIFMVFFFGIAAKEITESCLPGGSLNPPSKAVNPLIATIGGVAGPVGVFFGFMFLARSMNLSGYGDLNAEDWAGHLKGWGIPTATDIALAWLVARTVFGKSHPAVNFLLLLAVADDAIGLGIIAIFYGDPLHPAAPEYLGLVALGMAVAYALRRMQVMQWWPYILVAGPIAWCGLMLAHLHPALALVPIVPFLPGPKRDTGLFVDTDEVDVMGEDVAHDLGIQHSPLHNYEHQTKAFVDFGLFFFAMGNAGVELAGMGLMTWVILASLVVGKTIGVAGFSLFAKAIGFPLPQGMNVRDLIMAGFVAALGLTVALFVCGAAFPTDLALQGEAKMGALFSAFVGIAAIIIGKAMGFGKAKDR